MMQFDFQKISRDGVEAAMQSFGALSTGMQSAAVEVSDYTKRSYEAGTKAAESLMGARSVETALQVQGDYLKASYEGFVAQATKMGEIAQTTAKKTFAPVETLVKSFQAA